MEVREHDSHKITVLGPMEDGVWEQTLRCLAPEEGSVAVINADNHLGYAQAIGVGIGYAEHISVSGVGYDIGCGNKAVHTDLLVSDIGDDMPAIMDRIAEEIRFGMGGRNKVRYDHPVLEEIANADFEPQRALLDTAHASLGTVGTGNHYVDIFADENGAIWVGVHFGSRGFGHKTATGFLAIAQGLPFSERERKAKGLKVKDGPMESPPTLLHVDSEEGQAYIAAMELAGRYAYAGRDIVVGKVLEILGAEAGFEVHNHHNFAWQEEHDGRKLWVVRKGCTPAFPGQQGFVGSTMGEDSVILEGTEDGEPALYSTVHGAGRVMSRTAAAGKFKVRKYFECCDRDCSRLFDKKGHNPKQPPRGLCPDHPEAKTRNVKIRERALDGDGNPRLGQIDWTATQDEVRARGIELRGAAADEAPGAYKRLTDVLAAQGSTIRIRHTLTPLGVAMAPADLPERPDD